MSRPDLEVADVVRQHGEAFLERYGHTLSGVQHRTRAIELCRPSALSGYTIRCDHCGHEGVTYSPCRNQHCPTFQGVTRAAWLTNRQREVLDTPYEHAVCTLFPRTSALSFS